MKKDLAEKILAIANEEDRPEAVRAPEIVELTLHGKSTWGIVGIPPEELASLILHAPEEFLDGPGYYDVQFKVDRLGSELVVY